jgi:4-hydroxy-3-methylbut-2-en-1-yl diphosphate synthase IspG/GcpE
MDGGGAPIEVQSMTNTNIAAEEDPARQAATLRGLIRTADLQTDDGGFH